METTVATQCTKNWIYNYRAGLIREHKPGASDALQLCSLLLPQTNRMRLHRLLRLINKASSNSQLRLSRTHTNREVVRGQ